MMDQIQYDYFIKLHFYYSFLEKSSSTVVLFLAIIKCLFQQQTIPQLSLNIYDHNIMRFKLS